MSFLYPDITIPANGPLITPQSAEGMERRKWEQHFGPLGPPGNPYVFREYPKAMYRAGRPNKANVEITGSCTAKDASEEAVLKGQGWHPTQEAAIQAVHDQHREFATLAAERHYQERSMSEAAQREAAAVDSETVQHVPVIPETPIKRRGRPQKTEATA